MDDANEEQPAVFIASHDASDYSELLSRGLGQHAFNTVDKAAQVVAAYQGEPVVLGRPDFIRDLLATSPPVQWVQSTWAGVTPLMGVEFKNYKLTGVKDVFGPQMAEYVFGYLLAYEIRVEQRQDSQRQRHWDDRLSGTLRDKTIGIMGTGSIGSYLASTARTFGLHPLGYNSRGTPVEPFDRVYCKATIGEFLRRCDYLVGVLPATPATDALLDEAAFACMKESAYLINVGRGNLIDDAALIGALKEQRIAGAILDVFRDEPLPKESPLWTVPGLRITAHIAAVSRVEDVARLFTENYRRFTRGRELRYLVDFSRGY